MNIEKKAFRGQFPLQINVVRLDYISSYHPDLTYAHYNPKQLLSKSQVETMLQKMRESTGLNMSFPLFSPKSNSSWRNRRFNPYFQKRNSFPPNLLISKRKKRFNIQTPTIKDVLIALNLQKYLGKFKQHEVEFDDLRKLGEEDLAALISKIGPRARLKYFIKKELVQ